MIEKKKLFNPKGDDTISSRKLVGGSTTNLIQLNSVRYKWATQLYDRMLGNFWIPQKVDLSQDVGDYKLLTEDEKIAFDGVLSFLVFLDSLQVSNIPHISDYITAPEVNLTLSVHCFQESTHSASYQYLIESLLDKEKRDAAYEFWRKDSILFERNKYIASIFQEFLDNPTEEAFFRVLVANYLLESIYFYNGFTFFYSLATRHLMGGTADIIKYIQKDELTHVVLFQNIIREYVNQNGLTNYQSTIYELTQIAVEQEIKWTNHIIGNKILGMNEESTEIHTKYLANTRLKSLNLELNTLYPGAVYRINPYVHLEKLGDTQGKGEVKANFFEQTVTEYNMSSTVKGWDF
jgi:ribonucleoside-diphosphate reductase beta chain